MELGAFSISLAVKDLAASIAFYEKLGFSQPFADPNSDPAEQQYAILKKRAWCGRATT